MSNHQEEQARCHQELQAAKEKYDSLFQGAGDSIYIVDAETLQIVDANTHAARRLGYTREELLQLTLLDIEVICETDADDNLAWESTFSGTRVYECEYRRQDGSVVPVEVSSRLTLYDGRDVLQNFVRDITERKQADQQRLELMLERERIQILANFITQASHEFRTPLSTIQTSAYVLGKNPDPDTLSQQTHRIKGQVQTITTLVDSLTLMARLDGGGQDFQLTKQDLNELLRDVREAMHALLLENDQDLRLELTDEPLTVEVDGDYLKRAMQHLVENALRHTPAGSPVTVRTTHKQSIATVEIIDTGDGISDKDLPRIFERFFRGDKAGTTRGFGLGLPIAKAIIELHHGRIDVKSKVAQGSTFRIVLPLV